MKALEGKELTNMGKLMGIPRGIGENDDEFRARLVKVVVDTYRNTNET